LGAATDVEAGSLRWLSPLALWTGILAGPTAWAFDLGVSYALVKAACDGGHVELLRLITPASLLVVAAGAAISWGAIARTRMDEASGGGRPRERAHFMAVLGLTANAFFALAILALAIPRWVLVDACR
jgi:hypothetical protein